MPVKKINTPTKLNPLSQHLADSLNLTFSCVFFEQIGFVLI